MQTPIDADTPVETDGLGRASYRRSSARTLAVAAGSVLLFALILAGLRLTRPGALPGIVLSGVEVGGLQGDALRTAVEKVAKDRAAITITATRDGKRVAARAADLGYRTDLDKTV